MTFSGVFPLSLLTILNLDMNRFMTVSLGVVSHLGLIIILTVSACIMGCPL
jgi:hypothetical protein